MDNMWNPKHVKQKHSDCGQCCVAMITHLPVEIIHAQIGHKRGTTTHSVEGLLRWFGIEYTPYQKGSLLPDLCIAHHTRHWCIVYLGWVYDSNYEWLVHISEYKHRIKGFIKIEVPNI